MKKLLGSMTALALLLAGRPALAERYIYIRVSYKVVLNPADGTRPPGITDALLNGAVSGMNSLLAAYGRGYRIQMGTAITDVGGKDDTTGPSMFYNTNFFADDGTAQKAGFEAAALANKTAYAWDDSSINLYVTNGFGGGLCSFPSDGERIIVIGRNVAAGAGNTTLHEIGHYFSMAHTQGRTCSCCDTTLPGSCTSPGDDFVNDTLPDLACWNQDQIAQNAFTKNYADLTDDQKRQVDDVLNNLMSYHGTTCGPSGSQARLTEQQLDRWTNSATVDRRNIVTGRTWFADANYYGGQDGSPATPYRSVQTAVLNAQPGDIVLLRPGNYGLISAPVRLSRTVTLRATRGGGVRVGVGIFNAPTVTPQAPVQPVSTPVEEILRDVPGVFPAEPVPMGFPGGVEADTAHDHR